MKKLGNAAKYLKDTGLIFDINRKVLHPIGLALGYEMEIDGTLSPLFLFKTDDPEGIVFTDEVCREGFNELSKYFETHDIVDKLPLRFKKYGTLIQQHPDFAPTPQEGDNNGNSEG